MGSLSIQVSRQTKKASRIQIGLMKDGAFKPGLSGLDGVVESEFISAITEANNIYRHLKSIEIELITQYSQ